MSGDEKTTTGSATAFFADTPPTHAFPPRPLRPLRLTLPAFNFAHPAYRGMKHMQLQNYIAGTWVAGSGKQAELLDASTGELIATTARNVQRSMFNAQCSSTERR